MKKVGWLERLRYAFDNSLSRGPAGLIVYLALITLVLVLGTSLCVLLAGSDPDKDVAAILWNILFQTLTPNPVDPQAGSAVFLGAMLFASLGSLFLVSIFIGILTNAIDHRIQNLRKGRSTVLESGHTLVLGWSPQIFTLIAELCIANANQRQACIAILADRDKIEMEDEIRARVPQPGRTRIVCRTGSPLDPIDLEIVNPHAARSIILLAPESDQGDTAVIKSMLALTRHPQRKAGPYHIVAALREPGNLEVARMVGRDDAELILISELISHIMVQTCRQTGLSLVYTELLNFEGDEIYFQAEPALAGKTFGEALLAYEDSSVLGLQFADGHVQLNPPMDTRLTAGDQLIAISEDDDTIKLSGRATIPIDASASVAPVVRTPAPERTVILGWNHQAPAILNGLENYVAPGSETLMVASVADGEQQIARGCSQLQNQAVSFKQADITSRSTLDALAVPTFQHVIVLSDSDTLDLQGADAQTLITLLHLRDIRERSGREFSIVSEMLDVRNRLLAEMTRADDFIVSDQLVSLVLAQVSENRALNAVFSDLFDPAGSEIYLKPAEAYVRLAQAVTFYTVVESARRRSEIAIGYRLARSAHDPDQSYGIVVNPDKSGEVAFEAGDRIIVLAEH